MNETLFRWNLVTLCALILSAVLGSTSANAQVGFSHRDGSLHRFELVTDGSLIGVISVGDTGVPGISGSMAQSPDGTLYAAHHLWPYPYRLYALDPETAEATLIGDLDLGIASALASDMTFDDQGRLWLLSLGTLFQIDPATAAATVIADGIDTLRALAFRNGVFYGIAGDPATSQWSLVSVDPATGDLTPIADMSGIVSGSCHITYPAAADFDHDGGLWVSVTSALTCILPDFGTGIAYYSDPLTGIVTSQSPIDGADWYPALALQRPRQAAVEVPALGVFGFLLLSAALAAAGFVLLAAGRRSETGGQPSW